MNNDFSNGNWPTLNPLLDFLFFFFFEAKTIYIERLTIRKTLRFIQDQKTAKREDFWKLELRGLISEITGTSRHLKHQPPGVSWLPALGLVRTRVGGRAWDGHCAERHLRSVCLSHHHPDLLHGRWPSTGWRTGISTVCLGTTGTAPGNTVRDRHPSSRRAPRPAELAGC